MNKLLALFAILALVLGSSIGAQAKTGGTVTFWLMSNAPDDVAKPWLDAQAAQFEKNTGTKLKYEIVGWGDALTRISTAIATGEGPDVVQLGTTWNPQFAATKGLEEINVAEFGGASAFVKANLASTAYKGKYYGVPWFAETRALFYNKDLFAKAGVKPPKTYDELLKVAETIKEKLGTGVAISLAGTNAWDLLHNWAIILYANGGSILSPDNKTPALNSAAGVTALKYYLSLFEKGYASKACAEYNQPQADAAFINGNAAMCFMGPWNIAGIEHDNPTLNYGIVEPPSGPKGKASFSGGSNLAILKASKNKEGAKAFVKFMISDPVLLDWSLNIAKFLPATQSAAKDPRLSTGNWKVFKDTIAYATAYPTLGIWADIENAIQTNFKAAIADYINGKYKADSVKKYLDTAATQIKAAVAKEK